MHHYNDHIPLRLILTFLKTKLDILSQQGRLIAAQNTSICPKCHNYQTRLPSKLLLWDFRGTSPSKTRGNYLVNCLTDLCSRILSNDSPNISHLRKLTLLQRAHQSAWWVSWRDMLLMWSMINSFCWFGI